MKKNHIILGVLMLVVIGLAVLSIHKANSAPKGLTVQQAVAQRNDALTDLKIQKQLNDNDQKAAANQISDLKGQVTTATTTNTTLCTQIKAARLVQPLCK